MAALVTGLVVAAAVPASATKLVDDGWGGCVKPPNNAWTSYGAHSHVRIEDDFTRNNVRSFHINYSKSYGELADCGPAGRRVGGGTVTLDNGWRVNGISITSCTISAGGGCTISGGRVASRDYKIGPMASSGFAQFNGGGWNVYASTSGEIKQYTHDADVKFQYGAYVTTAGSANTYYY